MGFSTPSASAPAEEQGLTSTGRRVKVEFLYLDLIVCTRCRGTEKNLGEAVAKVKGVLEAAGVALEVERIHVTSEEQAAALGFISSPTIRVNGRDVQPHLLESRCEDCDDLCGEVCDCRVWTYGGKEFTAPPPAMLIDAILSAVYGGPAESIAAPQPETREAPANLRRFFAGKRKKDKAQAGKPCCPPSTGCQA